MEFLSVKLWMDEFKEVAERLGNEFEELQMLVQYLTLSAFNPIMQFSLYIYAR